MERHSRLTYERLVNTFIRLQGAIKVHFPDSQHRERASDLQSTIDDALNLAHDGMSGAYVISPVELKRQVEAKIQEIHERHDAIEEHDNVPSTSDVNTAAGPSAAASNPHPSLGGNSSLTRNAPVLRRTSRTLNKGKENATPSAVPAQPLVPKKPSAVVKTTITKRPTSKRYTTYPPPPESPLSDADERRAAAAALLGLCTQPSPVLSFGTPYTPPSSTTVSADKGKKRARSDFEDQESPDSTRAQDPTTEASSPPAPKRRMLAPATYAPIPEIKANSTAQEAFVLGVQYAVEQLQGCVPPEGAGLAAGLQRSVVEALGGGRRKDFWAVV